MAGTTAALPPPGLRVRLARGVRLRDGGRRLTGGTPFRLMRLTDTGAEHLRGWENGGAVSTTPSARLLVRRLLDAGVLVSDGDPDAPALDVDVVVPTHGRAEQLERCLAALDADGHCAVVVDDGSPDPAAIATVAESYGARVVRLEPNRGAAAARNVGLQATARPFVAFVDSDVVVRPGWLNRLGSQFVDPVVALAGPRVSQVDHRIRPGWVASYENDHSPLDMGPSPGDAGPGHRIPFLVSAALMARRSAIGAGFVESLSIGEDVDLCWRLSAAGWRVVYDPGAVVGHDHRIRLGPLLRRRWTYGGSIVPLSARHPGSLPPFRASALTSGTVAAAATGRPLITLGLLGWRGVGLRAKLGGDTALAARVTGQDLWSTSVGGARAVRRAWSPPLLIAALASDRVRHLLLASLILRLAEDDRLAVRHLPLAALDDLVAALSLWAACAEHRVLAPLLPTVRT